MFWDHAVIHDEENKRKSDTHQLIQHTTFWIQYTHCPIHTGTPSTGRRGESVNNRTHNVSQSWALMNQCKNTKKVSRMLNVRDNSQMWTLMATKPCTYMRGPGEHTRVSHEAVYLQAAQRNTILKWCKTAYSPRSARSFTEVYEASQKRTDVHRAQQWCNPDGYWAVKSPSRETCRDCLICFCSLSYLLSKTLWGSLADRNVASFEGKIWWNSSWKKQTL